MANSDQVTFFFKTKICESCIDICFILFYVSCDIEQNESYVYANLRHFIYHFTGDNEHQAAINIYQDINYIERYATSINLKLNVKNIYVLQFCDYSRVNSNLASPKVSSTYKQDRHDSGSQTVYK